MVVVLDIVRLLGGMLLWGLGGGVRNRRDPFLLLAHQTNVGAVLSIFFSLLDSKSPS
jgi:hypothetical protein